MNALLLDSVNAELLDSVNANPVRLRDSVNAHTVDEWYIDMGWRDEIATAARTARWVPDHLLELELDWLRNMGDWMISKKRYWGLALPIWECRSCGWFDVIGSRDYWIHPFMRKAEEFIDELSNWYVRLNRRRFWKHATDDIDKTAAYQTLYEVLVKLSLLLAPVIPFLTERLYQNLVVAGDPSRQHPRSVHHCSYPESQESLVDTELAQDMAVTQQLVSSALGLRTEGGHRVRQPLSELRVWGHEPSLRSLKRFEWLIRDQLNVKRVSFEAAPEDPDWTTRDGGALRVGLHVALTPELRREGLARDMVRHIQTLRKSAGLTPEDRIWIDLNTDDSDLAEAIATWSDYLRSETLCDDLRITPPAQGQIVRVGGRQLLVELGPTPRPDVR